MVDVIHTTSDITPEWLTLALRDSGTIKSSVTSVELSPLGAGVGLMAELCRLTLEYEGDESAPTSIIAKCAAQNDNIQVARILDFYNRETNFYNKIGNDCHLKVPESYFGAVDQDSYDFILLLEDLGDVSPRDQIVGASSDEAFSAIERIAAMHADWWGKVDDTSGAWMYDFMSSEEAGKLQAMVYGPAQEATLEKFDSFFDDESRKTIRVVGDNFPAYWTDNITATNTFIHGDYRQDNMIYQADSLDAIVMDWQICGKGKGIFDFTYFMCQSLPSSTRREIEREILTLYAARLKDHGVNDYGFEQCWHDYRYMVLGCLVYPVTVCGSLDTANERGRALAETMLERNLTAINELGCKELLALR